MFDVLTYFRAELDTVGRHFEEIIGSLDPQQALRRPQPDINHVLWLTGHMTWAEDFLICEVPKDISFRRRDWDTLFDCSSEKMASGDYPPWNYVRSEYLRVHSQVMQQMKRLTNADLVKPSAIEKSCFPTPSYSIAHQVTHGQYHLGQLVYLHKLLVPTLQSSSVLMGVR